MIYELTIDGKVSFVRSTQEKLTDAMYAYIREQRAKGRSLAEIVYCWRPVTIRSI